MNNTSANTATKTIKRGRGNRNIQELLEYAIRSKRFIGGLCKLERDGTLTKINGQAFSIRTTKAGLAIVLIDNFLGSKRPGQKRRWQAVLVKNVICLRENKWEHKKVD